MITYFDNFLNETRYFLENIDKKYYVFHINKRYYLIEITRINDIKKLISFNLPLVKFLSRNDRRVPPFARNARGERTQQNNEIHYGRYYTTTIGGWKRNLYSVVFSTNNLEEAMDYIDSKEMKRPDIDPYGEEDWCDD